MTISYNLPIVKHHEIKIKINPFLSSSNLHKNFLPTLLRLELSLPIQVVEDLTPLPSIIFVDCFLPLLYLVNSCLNLKNKKCATICNIKATI